MKITKKDLEIFGACQEGIDLFIKIFGDSAVINQRNLKKAIREFDRLDIGWFVLVMGTYLPRSYLLKDPWMAYYCAKFKDKCAMNDTRIEASKSPFTAFRYARGVDKGPHDTTRQGVLSSLEHSWRYAIEIDKRPHNQTRAAVRGDPGFAGAYARWEVFCGEVESDNRLPPQLSLKI